MSIIQEMRETLKRNKNLLPKSNIFNYKESVKRGIDSEFMREAIKNNEMSPKDFEQFKLKLEEDRKRTNFMRYLLIGMAIIVSIVIVASLDGFFGQVIYDKTIGKPKQLSEQQWFSLGKKYHEVGMIDSAHYCYRAVLSANNRHLDAHIQMTQLFIEQYEVRSEACDSAKLYFEKLKGLGFVDPRIEEFERMISEFESSDNKN